MKKNNKGFTLVELIVVLVILAILAAILVPALLGWIDKAREKSVTSNAEAAFVATQGKITECYGNYSDTHGFTFSAKASAAPSVKAKAINTLADIDDPGATISYKTKTSWKASVKEQKSCYQISEFTYTSGSTVGTGKYEAVWNSSDGSWTVNKLK